MERRELPRYPVIDIAATGQNLRRLRLEKGYSVKELQEYLGLGCPQGVYQWQAGRSLPSVDNLYACLLYTSTEREFTICRRDCYLRTPCF